MLLALSLLQLTALTLANPFHKYPYVFLLDVGNEELEKVNTEQIRVSKQGGSLALRFPAIGNGDDIAHVRVSGIDFGTDLKASIVDGGPGYKYVVLVLIGNPGVNFDAVITVQTLPSDVNEENLQNVDNTSGNDGQVSEENDANNSAEDLSESAESVKASQVSVKENAELTQESSNVYSYAVNEALSGYGDKIHSNVNYEDENDKNNDEDDSYNTNDDNDSEQEDITPYKENQIEVEEENSEFDDYSNEGSSPSRIDELKAKNNDDYYSSVSDDDTVSDDDENEQQIRTKLNEQYDTFRQNKYEEGEEYPQRFIPNDSGTVYIEESGDNERPFDLEEIFGDDYDNADSRENSDSNNNYFIDRNDGSAVAY